MNRGRQVRRHNDRVYMMAFDEDGDDVYPHFLVICPPDIKTKLRATEVMDRIFRETVQTNIVKNQNQGEDWTYDDYAKALKKAGFEIIQAGFWVENACNMKGVR